jgi:DNA-directed RNA polymerase subunit RPC12/RpoP
LFAADPAGPYVALSETFGRDEYLITPGRAFGDLSNAVTEQMLLGPMEVSMSFGAEFDPGEFASLSAALDWRTRTLLQATLERHPSPNVEFSAREALEMLVEGASSDDPAWAVTLFQSLIPQVDFALAEADVESALRRLAESGFVTTAGEQGWRFSELLESLAESLQPFGTYAAVHLEAWKGDEPIEASHLAFVRGPFALVVIRPTQDGRRRSVMVDAITDIELADLLMDLAALPPASGSGTAEAVCPHCGAAVEDDQRFCAQCGGSLEGATPSQAIVCPSCGAVVDPGEGQYCAQCGAAVAPPPGGDAS